MAFISGLSLSIGIGLTALRSFIPAPVVESYTEEFTSEYV